MGGETPVRVGIIGAGAVARAWHAPTLEGLPGVRLTAVSDRNAEAGQSLASRWGARHCDVDQLIAECDWVIVTTPPSSHADLVERALQADRLVVVEKPFVTRIAEAERLVGLAASRTRGLYVAQMRRFAGAVNLARDLVMAGVLGRVEELEVFEGGRFGWETLSRYVQEDPFGGVLFDTGSHSLDQALYAAGLDEVSVGVKVEAVARDRAEPAHEIDARFRLESKLPGGAGNGVTRGRLRLSRYETLGNLVRIRGERGTLEFGVSFETTVWLRTATGRVRMEASGPARPIGACFAAQYRSLKSEGKASRLAAERMLNQVRVLSAIHAHG